MSLTIVNYTSIPTASSIDDAFEFLVHQYPSGAFERLPITQVLNPTAVGLGNVSNVAQVPLSAAGVAGGVATLDGSGYLLGDQMPAITGDITITAGTTTSILANSGVSANTYGSSTQAVSVTVDAKGRITAISNVALNAASVGLVNVTNDAQVKRSEMGVASGVATLDSNGFVPSSQLNLSGGSGLSVWNLTPVSLPGVLAQLPASVGPVITAIVTPGNVMTIDQVGPGFEFAAAYFPSVLAGGTDQWVVVFPNDSLDGNPTVEEAFVGFGQNIGSLVGMSSDPLVFIGGIKGSLGLTWDTAGSLGSDSGLIDAAYVYGDPFMVIVNPTSGAISVNTTNGTFSVPQTLPANSYFWGLIALDANDSGDHIYQQTLSTDSGVMGGFTAPPGSSPVGDVALNPPNGTGNGSTYACSGSTITYTNPGDSRVFTLNNNDVVEFNSATDIADIIPATIPSVGSVNVQIHAVTDPLAASIAALPSIDNIMADLPPFVYFDVTDRNSYAVGTYLVVDASPESGHGLSAFDPGTLVKKLTLTGGGSGGAYGTFAVINVPVGFQICCDHTSFPNEILGISGYGATNGFGGDGIVFIRMPTPSSPYIGPLQTSQYSYQIALNWMPHPAFDKAFWNNLLWTNSSGLIPTATTGHYTIDSSVPLMVVDLTSATDVDGSDGMTYFSFAISPAMRLGAEGYIVFTLNGAATRTIVLPDNQKYTLISNQTNADNIDAYAVFKWSNVVPGQYGVSCRLLSACDSWTYSTQIYLNGPYTDVATVVSDNTTVSLPEGKDFAVVTTIDGQPIETLGLTLPQSWSQPQNNFILSDIGKTYAVKFGVSIVNVSFSTQSTYNPLLGLGGAIPSTVNAGDTLLFRFTHGAMYYLGRMFNGDLNGAAALDGNGYLLGTQFPALTGDITTTAGSLATTLANTSVVAGGYGDNLHTISLSVDSKGRITDIASYPLPGTSAPSFAVPSPFTGLNSNIEIENSRFYANTPSSWAQPMCPITPSPWQVEWTLQSFGFTDASPNSVEFGVCQEMVNLSQAARTPMQSLIYAGGTGWSMYEVDAGGAVLRAVTWYPSDPGQPVAGDILGLGFDPTSRVLTTYLKRGITVYTATCVYNSNVAGTWTATAFIRGLGTFDGGLQINYNTGNAPFANTLNGYKPAFEEVSPSTPVCILLGNSDSEYHCQGGIDYFIIDNSTSGCAIYLPNASTSSVWTDQQKVRVRGNASGDTFLYTATQAILEDGTNGYVTNLYPGIGLIAEVTACVDTNNWIQSDKTTGPTVGAIILGATSPVPSGGQGSAGWSTTYGCAMVWDGTYWQQASYPSSTFASLPVSPATGITYRVTNIGNGALMTWNGSLWVPFTGNWISLMATGVGFLLSRHAVVIGANGAISDTGQDYSATGSEFLYVAGAPNAFYQYFTANAIDTVSAAGWYWVVLSSGTTGTVYNNTYTSGIPTVPASLTAFSGTVGSTMTIGDVTVNGITFTIPGGFLGSGGQITVNSLGRSSAASGQISSQFGNAILFNWTGLNGQYNVLGQSGNRLGNAKQQYTDDSGIANPYSMAAGSTATGSVDSTADVIFETLMYTNSSAHIWHAGYYVDAMPAL